MIIQETHLDEIQAAVPKAKRKVGRPRKNTRPQRRKKDPCPPSWSGFSPTEPKHHAPDISPVSDMSGVTASPNKAHSLTIASLRSDPKGPLNIITTGKGRKREGELHRLDHIKRSEGDGWKLVHGGIKLYMLPQWFDEQVRL